MRRSNIYGVKCQRLKALKVTIFPIFLTQFQPLKVTTIIPVRLSMGVPPRGSVPPTRIVPRSQHNPIPPGRGGEGGGKCPRRFQLSRTSMIFKQNLQNVATFTKIYWRTRFWKNFASRVSHVAMATTFSTPCLLKC